ncbi:MAG: hypothetical protein JSV04_12260 [Candidatus Heimdallarchaeota archaeon]|nr:MAG: hypothetical protein JSV04_12260 [Candidatus Heimdallarchaeota archaeon]
MPAGQMTAHLFRILYIILFVFSALLVLFSLDPTMVPIPFINPAFDWGQIFNITEWIMLIVQELIRAFAGVAFSIVSFFAVAKARIPILGDANIGGVNTGGMTTKIANLADPLNGIFPHSSIDLTDPTVILTLIEDFSHFLGATAILILLPIAILSGIGFLREGDTKLAIYSFLGFQLIIIIAIFTQKILISTVIDDSTLMSMIFSPIFTLGFLLYLLLEIAFQTSYTLNIVEPMTEREKRIQEHLKRIRTFVPQSEEEAKGREHSVQSVQSKKFDLLAASYLREMVERRVFKKGETIQDAKSTMRLQSYLATLNQTDPQTDLKLAAQTAQPNISALLRHFIPAMAFRILAVIILSYIIMSPEGILNIFVANSFPALLDSLELTQPEFQTIAILNVVLFFILLGAVLHYMASGRTGKVLERVVQQIDTLVDFDREPRPAPVPGEPLEEEEEGEELLEDEEEKIT